MHNAPVTRTRKRPVLRAVLLIVLLTLGTSGGLASARALSPLPAATVSLTRTTVPAEKVGLPWTASGVSAIGLVDGTVLAAGPNADKIVPTASIAKLITVLAVLKKHPLKEGEQGPTLVLTDTDVALRSSYAARGGSTVPVQNGEHITEYQMIEAMLLPSANNMADSLATWAYGSPDAYRSAAQDMVKDMGMGNTTVGDDASGLSPTTTSTARDLVTLGQAAYREPVIREIAAQASADLPVAGTVYSTNSALGSDGITGLKTGTSDEAGDCFLFAADHTFANGTGKSFVGVVMDAGSDDARFTAAESLLEATYSDFADRTVVVQGQSAGTVATAWGASSPVVAASDLSVFVWRGRTVAVTAKASAASADIRAGRTVGTLSAEGKTIPLVAKNGLAGPDLLWRIRR